MWEWLTVRGDALQQLLQKVQFPKQVSLQRNYILLLALTLAMLLQKRYAACERQWQQGGSHGRENDE